MKEPNLLADTITKYSGFIFAFSVVALILFGMFFPNKQKSVVIAKSENKQQISLTPSPTITLAPTINDTPTPTPTPQITKKPNIPTVTPIVVHRSSTIQREYDD